jgi:hypothetical protein
MTHPFVLMKNLIIGVVDNLPWEKVRPWAVSLRKTGFTGDVVILGYRMDEGEVRMGCEKFGIELVLAKLDDQGQPIDHARGGLDTQAFRWRNYHVWKYLQETDRDYGFVALIDTSDVVFQRNPDDFFKELRGESPGIYLPSEGVLIENEKWTARLIQENFGEAVFDKLKKFEACNGGTMFGTTKEFAEFNLELFRMVRDVDVIGIDQPAMNLLAESFPAVKRLPVSAGWACQCGTMLDPMKIGFQLVCDKPMIRNGAAYYGEKPFVLFHQYTRDPDLRNPVAWKYVGVPMKFQWWYRALRRVCLATGVFSKKLGCLVA